MVRKSLGFYRVLVISMLFSFGTCVFDTDQRLLTRSGAIVHLPPKAAQLLEVLIQSRPAVVGRDELHDALWPKTFVARTNLPSLVAELRAAIDDRGHGPRLIRTVHAVGYAFAGEVIERGRVGEPTMTRELDHRLILFQREVALGQGDNLLGRTADAAVWLDDEQVSRLHARIVIDGSAATIEDLGSKNGTYVGKNRISDVTPLRDGDVIWIGPFSMTFRVFAFGQTTRSAAIDATSRTPQSSRHSNAAPRSRSSSGR